MGENEWIRSWHSFCCLCCIITSISSRCSASHKLQWSCPFRLSLYHQRQVTCMPRPLLFLLLLFNAVSTFCYCSKSPNYPIFWSIGLDRVPRLLFTSAIVVLAELESLMVCTSQGRCDAGLKWRWTSISTVHCIILTSDAFMAHRNLYLHLYIKMIIVPLSVS